MFSKSDLARLRQFCRMVRVVCCAMLPPCSALAATASPWGNAQDWVGHTASQSLGSGGASFFALPEIAWYLPKLLTPPRRARFDSYTQTGRVARVDHFLTVTVCRPGACAQASFTVVLDMSSQNIWLIEHRTENGQTSRCWSGTKQIGVLPNALQTPLTGD